jgi:hypothetical protein
MQQRSREDKQEDRKETECIYLQSRSRQVPVLPNLERFELQKKYQLVEQLMVRGVFATYYYTILGARRHWKTTHVSSFGVRVAKSSRPIGERNY